MDKTYIALLSAAFGWFLNQLGQWLSNRQQDRKVKKKVLFNLLEVYFIISKFDYSDLLEFATNEVFKLFPKENQTEEAKKALNGIYSKILPIIIQANVNDELEGVEDKYNNAVESLSEISPITAYRLNGKTKVFEVLRKTYDSLSDTMQSEKIEEADIDDTIKTLKNKVEPTLIKELMTDIEDEIHEIAFSINLSTWIKTKKTINRIKNRIREEGKKRYSDFIKQIMAGISV